MGLKGRVALATLGGCALVALLLGVTPVRGAGELATEIVIQPIEPVTVGAEFEFAFVLRVIGGGGRQRAGPDQPEW